MLVDSGVLYTVVLACATEIAGSNAVYRDVCLADLVFASATLGASRDVGDVSRPKEGAGSFGNVTTMEAGCDGAESEDSVCRSRGDENVEVGAKSDAKTHLEDDCVYNNSDGRRTSTD